MTLSETSETKSRRWYLMTKESHLKRRLAYAYAHKDPARILQAKFSLIRILKELSLSPEFSNPPLFKWGHRLELMLKVGADPNLTWQPLYNRLTLYAAAEVLEYSIDYISP